MKKPKPEPLVSIIIPTYQWVDGLFCAVSSCTRQTYRNLEIIVVGDACDEATEDMLIDNFCEETRVQYFNLPVRGDGKYPSNAQDKWLVAGVPPCNKGLEMATGEWLCILNDDDTYVPDAIENLLKTAEESGCKFVYGLVEFPQKAIVGHYPPSCGNITADAAMWHKDFQHLRYDIECWKRGRPADWDFFMRLMMAGAKPAMLSKVVALHSGHQKRLGW